MQSPGNPNAIDLRCSFSDQVCWLVTLNLRIFSSLDAPLPCRGWTTAVVWQLGLNQSQGGMYI